jgi:hypothetical protein
VDGHGCGGGVRPEQRAVRPVRDTQAAGPTASRVALLSCREADGAAWNMFTPRLFRHLKPEHVEAFWADGGPGLSSFAQFATHGDEQRHDANEGSAGVICRTEDGEGRPSSHAQASASIRTSEALNAIQGSLM